MSKPQQIHTRQDDLFRSRLSTQLNPKHPLFMLTKVIDWEGLEASFEPLYQSELVESEEKDIALSFVEKALG